MTQYINKSAVVAEIDDMLNIKEHTSHCDEDSFNSGRWKALTKIKNFLNTIEAKEEILDESGKTNLMQESVREAFKSGFEMGVLQTTNKMNHNTKEVDLEKEIELIKGDYEQVEVAWNNDFDFIARHFYELGLNVNKGK